MAKKYTCPKCIQKADSLTSYFVDGARVTACDECADKLRLKDNLDKEHYNPEAKDPKKYDTRVNATN